LAVANSLLAGSLPFAANSKLKGYWRFGKVPCVMTESIKLINFFGSIFTLTAMAIDRFILICKPKVGLRV